MRRSGPSLHHCLVPRLRSAAASRWCRIHGKPDSAAPSELQFGTLGWKLGGFRADNSNDILDIPSTVVQGFGYFQNVGSTRRQGIEAEVTLKSNEDAVLRQLYLCRRALPERTCSSAPTARLPTPTAISRFCRATKSRRVPRNRVKAGFDYAVTDAFKVGGDAQYIGSQYFVGDEFNQYPKLPGYAVFNLHASYQIDKNFQIYAKADNIFDNRYANYGTFFDTTALPNFANGGAAFTDPQSLSPARPRALYAGMRITF